MEERDSENVDIAFDESEINLINPYKNPNIHTKAKFLR